MTVRYTILSLGYIVMSLGRAGEENVPIARNAAAVEGGLGRSFNPARPSLNQIAFLGEKFQFPRPVVSFCSRLPPVSIYPVYASFLPPICVCSPSHARRDRYYNQRTVSSAPSHARPQPAARSAVVPTFAKIHIDRRSVRTAVRRPPTNGGTCRRRWKP